jgi:hypothetical protein
MLYKASTRNVSILGTIVAATLGITACSSMKLPILKQETGEALGAGRFRVQGELGTGRTVPIVPAALASVTTPQDGSLFSGGLIRAGVSYGVAASTDLQLGTSYSIGGGGWRLGVKNQFVKGGAFALSGMVGYGQHSAKGSFDLDDSGNKTKVETVLSGRQIDLGIPVSYRFGQGSVLYSGLTANLESVSGSANAESVDQGFTDLVFNLGFRQAVSAQIDLSFELALAKLGGPFGADAGLKPYFGLGIGASF